MADKSHILTDEKLEEMERHLSAIYSTAQKDIQKKADEYFDKFKKDDAKKRDLVKQGKLTDEEYKTWRQNKIMYGKRFTAMKEDVAKQLLNVNQTATAYINGELPEIYTLNYNALADTVDGVGGYSFTLLDRDTVKNLATTDKSLLPFRELDPAKDIPWNMKAINSEVLQGIVQGESIPDMSKRIFGEIMKTSKTEGLTDKELGALLKRNRDASIRSARTIVTGAENKGRQDSYARAEADGIILQKEWLATNDGRTRHSHAALDGAIVDQDKKFDNGLMYPGDPSGRPEEVYNCRCTLVAKVNGFKKVQVQKAMAEKQVEEPQTTESAIKTANDLGVKYAQFEKMPLEQVNNAIDAVRTLPKDCVPKVIASGKDVSTVTGRPLGRKADQWWGVTYDYREFSLRTMQLGYDATDFDGGLIVGLNTQKFKTLDALTKAKKATNDAYFAKTGRYWSFNTDGKATAYHEIGHCFADVRGLPKGWEDASARWAEESACDLLKKPDEAFAEAWAAYHLGDKRLPDYISAIIGGLK